MAATQTTKENDKEDVVIDEGVVGVGCFWASVELGTLPRPFLSPSTVQSAAAVAATALHGQPEERVRHSLPAAGPFVDPAAGAEPEATIATSNCDPFKVRSTGGCTAQLAF